MPGSEACVRILILHSRYLSGAASGENRVVEDEARLLERGDHAVEVWEGIPADLAGLKLLRAGVETLWSSRADAELRRRIRRGGFEIVHCHNLFPSFSPSVLRTAAAEGSSVVMTLHNFRFLCLPATFLRSGEVCEACLGHNPWRGVLHRCYRGSAPASGALGMSLSLHRAIGTLSRADLFLAVSGFVKCKHVQAGWPSERIRVKSNFAWAVPRREGPGDYFLYLGRLSREKGVAGLVEVWRNIPSPLLVVGEGPERERLGEAATPNVEFRDAVAPSEVPGLLARARALILPSIWYEGAPRIIVEAFAAGVPVLASRIGGIPEFVDHGVSGFLVSPGARDEWVATVLRLLDDEVAKQLGEGAWSAWRDRFSPERALEELESCYLQALSSFDG